MPLTDTFLKTIKYNRDDNKPQREYDTWTYAYRFNPDPNAIYLELILT